MAAMIELKNVDLSYQTQYQRVEVLRNVDLEVAENEYLVIMGKSGSGKSTLLNLMAGFIKATKGQVLVDNKDISKYNLNELNYYRNKKIGYITQSFNLIYQFTVLENVMCPMLIGGISQKEARLRAENLLSNIGLADRMKHFPNELSGGEQQRVAIARALGNDPELILADEPTGNLDFSTSKMILDCIDDIHKTGKTVVLVTHDEDIKMRANRVIFMEEILD